MVSQIVILSMVMGLACGATWQGRLPVKPPEHAHKQGCYIKEINDVIPFGEEVSPLGVCYRIECLPDQVAYASCGVSSTNDPKCYITNEDLRRPYPECCPDIKCEFDNDLYLYSN